MKCLLVICDGLGDRPIKELGGRTPLESAKTPNLDSIAKKGICGIVDTIAPGIRPGSDTAHLAILGHDPLTSYTGRGPFEAAGVGMEVLPGDIALRSNFATLDENGVVLDRRAGRITEGNRELEAAIAEISLGGVDTWFKTSTGHRGALLLRGEGLSHRVNDSDPHIEGVKPFFVEPLESSKESEKTSELLNRFIEMSTKVLRGHEVNRKRIKEGKIPANTLLLRGAGVAPDLEPFEKKYGLKGGCIATVALVRGVGKFCGLNVLGADPTTSIEELCSMALKEIRDYDFIMVNIKSCDDASHDGDYKKKIEMIEKIDGVASDFRDFSIENYLAIMADHTSPVSRKDHSGDPVPLVISGPEVTTDTLKVFSERSASTGGLCRIRGADVMNILVDLLNKSKKFGA